MNTDHSGFFVLVLVAVLLGTAEIGQTSPADKKEAPRQARRNYAWQFPQDHGAHPNYRTEWWYFTGILQTSDRTFGYQFTIFRQRTRETPRESSNWSTDQVFMAHMAVSDMRNTRHLTAHRTARGHPALAGADTKIPGRIHLRDWSLQVNEDEWIIQAGHRDVQLSLQLHPSKPPLFQGPEGYSSKGPKPGQASMYYSQTRMKTSGSLTINDKKRAVTGQTWFDHEFGSSQLSSDQEGWDWVSLRLSDGSDLMLYRLREKGGTVTPQSSVTIREPDGNVIYLSADQWTMTPLDHWTSSETSAKYPVRWRIETQDPALDLVVDSRFDEQEMVLENALTAPYWEGLVSASGTFRGKDVQGEGYLEMTGYVTSLSGSF